MDRFRPLGASLLVAWTLFTWGSRVPLLWTDDDVTGGDKVLQSIPIVVFAGLGLVALVLVLRGGWASEAARRVGLLLAVWTLCYWAVRLPFLVVNDHPAGFIAVHVVLATVAGLLALVTLAGLLPGRRSAPA